MEGLDAVTLFRHAEAIGLLYDFYVLKQRSPVFDEDGLPSLVGNFWEARRYGDDTLGWKPVADKTARDDLNAITQFSDFCSDNFGSRSLNPKEQVLVSSLRPDEAREWHARYSHQKRNDLLAHLAAATKKGRGEIEKRKFKPRKLAGSSRAISEPKHFPPDKVLEFIESTLSLRNRLCWLLMFFGGVRTSELAHIFVGDIRLDPSDGTAVVVVAHPLDGKMEWAHRGKRQKGTRARFLLEKYDRVARTELAKGHPDRAGWKGMSFDDVSAKESTVQWTDPRIGVLFWKMHLVYMRQIRLHIGDEHPYYFVSTKGDSFGEPMKLSALRAGFYANAKKIGLKSTQPGVNPHGARHFCGWYCANVLRLAKEETQKILHHAAISSTEIYYALDKAVVRREVELSHSRLHGSMPSFLNSNALLQSSGDDE